MNRLYLILAIVFYVVFAVLVVTQIWIKRNRHERYRLYELGCLLMIVSLAGGVLTTILFIID